MGGNALALKDRFRDTPVLGTAIAVQDRYNDDAAGQFAAAIAYFGFLSLFPLLLLALSAAGFVLANRPEVHEQLVQLLTRTIPGLREQLQKTLTVLQEGRAATGVVGLALLLFSGFRVIEAAAVATSRVFRVAVEENVVRKKAGALGILLVLGVLAVAGAGASSLVGIETTGPMQALFSIGGTALSIATDFALFLVAYRLLTARRGPPWEELWPGALMGSVGWTGLKVFGSTYVASQIQGSSAVYGSFAAVVGILLLLYLAARLYLYGAELNAVRWERRASAQNPTGAVNRIPPVSERGGSVDRPQA